MSLFKPPKQAPIPQPEQKPQTQQVENAIVGIDPQSSLIETSSQGLKRKASTQKSSLIGGYGAG